MWEKYQEMMKCVNKAKELSKNVFSLELQGAIYDECILLMDKYHELAKQFKWVKYVTILS